MEILTAALVILLGVAIYVLGQIIIRIVIQPVHELKSVIADTAFAIVRYFDVYKRSGGEKADNPFRVTVEPEELEEAADEYLHLAASLNAGLHLVPWYPLTRLFFALPSEKNTIYARDLLIKLAREIANVPRGVEIQDHHKQILSYLKVM